MAALPSKSDLVRALQIVLPLESAAQLEILASILLEAQGQPEPHLSDNGLGELLRSLAGNILHLGSSTVQFGSGNQFGDIIFRDVAGRDIIHTTIITAEQAYNVANLTNPYLGLRTFSYEDRDRFAGREQVIRDAVDLLATPGAQQTILFITGASGSGKSSLVQAGIVPALERAYAERNVPTCYAVMRPGTQPIAALGAALDMLKWPCGGMFAVADRFRLINPTLPSGPLPVGILVLDQAEELFRAEVDVPQRDVLIALLSAILPFPTQRLHFIVTLRADFLPDLFAYPILYRIAKSGIDLYAMDETQLQEAIRRPVQAQHPEKRLESALVDRLAHDAAQDATLLPLLQVTLEDLWRRGSMTLAHYGSLIDALRDRADAVMDYVDHDGDKRVVRPDNDREAILSIFLDLVAVSLHDDPRHDVRRRQTLATLVGDNAAAGAQRRRLIDELCKARLLAADVEVRDGRDVEVVDIIHESLLTHWPRLRAAIAERRDILQQRERFSLALAEWKEESRADAYLLTGVRLAEAEALQKCGDIALAQPDALDFYAQSIRRRDAKRQQQLRRTQLFAGTLGIFLVVAMVAGFLAFRQSGEAKRQTSNAQTAEANTQAELRRSESQHLAVDAQSALATDAETGLLLAYEASSRDDNSVTEQTLRDAIDAMNWRPTKLIGHTDTVYMAVFSPDGSRILTASRDGTARLWDTNGQPLATLSGHTDDVWSAVFSPDGSRILTASQDGTARLWDADGQPLATLKDTRSPVFSAVFSPDGTYILTTLADSTAQLWDVNGQFRATFSGHAFAVWDAAFSPDGSFILTASEAETIQLWDAHAQRLATLTGHTGVVRNAVFSPNGSFILTASTDQTARLWDTSGQLLVSFNGHTDAVYSAVFSPNGGYILTASADRTARLWSLRGKPLVTFNGHTADVTRAVFSPDGSRILTTSVDRTVRLWDTNGQLLAILSGHTPTVSSAVFSPDGRRILTASSDGTVRLWEANDQLLATLGDQARRINSAVFSPDGSHILTTSAQKTAQLWDVSGQLLATLTGHTDNVWSAVFSPDGSYILTTSSDGTARLWDTSGQPLATFSDQTSEVDRAIFSPDGSRILIGLQDNRWQLWDTSGQLLTTLSRYMPLTSSVVFNPDGSRILIAPGDQTAGLWDTSGQLLATLGGPTDNITSAIFSPDGSRILTAAEDGTAQLRDTRGQPLSTLRGHTATIVSMVFNSDGSRILTAAEDGTARLWDASGQPLAILGGHMGRITVAIFSPNGSRILTAAEDQTLRLWDASGQPRATLKGQGELAGPVMFSPDSSRILTALDNRTVWQYLVASEDLRRVAACRVGRELSQKEITRFQMHETLSFHFDKRQCPPVFSWEQATK